MENAEIDLLLSRYKLSVESLIGALRAETALPNAPDSMVAMENWDRSDLLVQTEPTAAKQARDRYKDALLQVEYGS